MTSSRYLRSKDTSAEGLLRTKLREEGGELLPLEKIDLAPRGIEEGELPESYSDDRLILLARSPYELFCYWDFSSLQAIDPNDLFLQIYENEHLIASQPIAAYPRRRCYIRLSHTGGIYRAVLIHSVLGKPLQRSNAIAPLLPPRLIRQNPAWITLDPDLPLDSQIPPLLHPSSPSADLADTADVSASQAILYATPALTESFTASTTDGYPSLPRVQFFAPTEIEDLDLSEDIDFLTHGSGLGIPRLPSSDLHAAIPTLPKKRPA